MAEMPGHDLREIPLFAGLSEEGLAPTDFDALVESEPSFALVLLRGLAARLAEARTSR